MLGAGGSVVGSAGAPKAQIEELDVVQALSYLRASGFEIGLILNFGRKRLGVKRVIHSGEGSADSQIGADYSEGGGESIV